MRTFCRLHKMEVIGLCNKYSDEEIAAEVRRLRAEKKREAYRRNPEAQRAANRRYWARLAIASLEAREKEGGNSNE